MSRIMWLHWLLVTETDKITMKYKTTIHIYRTIAEPMDNIVICAID